MIARNLNIATIQKIGFHWPHNIPIFVQQFRDGIILPEVVSLITIGFLTLKSYHTNLKVVWQENLPKEILRLYWAVNCRVDVAPCWSRVGGHITANTNLEDRHWNTHSASVRSSSCGDCETTDALDSDIHTEFVRIDVLCIVRRKPLPFLIAASIDRDRNVAARARRHIERLYNRIFTRPSEGQVQRIQDALEEHRRHLDSPFITRLRDWLRGLGGAMKRGESRGPQEGCLESRSTR